MDPGALLNQAEAISLTMMAIRPKITTLKAHGTTNSPTCRLASAIVSPSAKYVIEWTVLLNLVLS